ncbi:hypothetical protein Tco_0799915 [Tanacetum coccineum]|uniref:Uncharacterized protein n=1 Tax=Tanacetum coccineum TaxID=301880 RepID=A0ABQ4ZUX8_9ASTR
MSTLVFVDPESSTQADGAQSSRVPVPLPKDPYEAIRQAYLDGMDTESEPFEDPIDTETPESPLTIASPIPLSKSTPPVLVPILCRTARMAVRVPHTMSAGLSTDMAEVTAMSESAFRKRFWSSYESSPSMSPPDLPSQKHYRGTSKLVEDSKEDDDEEDKEIEESIDSDSKSKDAEDEGPTAEDEDPTARDEGLAAGDEGPNMGSSRSVPESERPERVSALRQPTLTTWIDLEDGITYIDVPAYPPPAPPAQTPPSLEWSFIPSPISSPMISLTVPSLVASPTTGEAEGFLTELGAQVEMQGGLIYDHTMENQELRLQIAEERRARLDLAEIVDSMRRG